MPAFEKLTQKPIVITEANQNPLHELAKTKKWIIVDMPINIRRTLLGIFSHWLPYP